MPADMADVEFLSVISRPDETSESCTTFYPNAMTDFTVAPLSFPSDFERFFWSHTNVMTHIYNELSLPALMALSFTQKQIFLNVADYQAVKISRLLLPFHIHYDQLLNALCTSGAIVVGSFALLCSIPLTSSFSITSIDFAIVDGRNHLDFLASIAPHLSFVPKAETLGPFPPAHPVKSSHLFAIVLDGQALAIDVNIMVVRWHPEGSSVYESLFYSPTSCGMNALSGDGIFSTYRRLLASSIGIVNDVHRSSIFQGRQNEDITHQLAYDNVSRHKYKLRGFSFPNPHFLHQPSVICEKDLSCPSTIRNVRDRGCAHMRIFSNSEIRNLTRCFSLYAGVSFDVLAPLIPFTIWRLTDPVSNSANSVMSPDIVCTFS